jgi:transcriptional regulator with GAF, ATPase, and Fis domain
MIEFEKTNIKRALEATSGRVSGENGAASLLNKKPTTLYSRLKAMKINY